MNNDTNTPRLPNKDEVMILVRNGGNDKWQTVYLPREVNTEAAEYIVKNMLSLVKRD